MSKKKDNVITMEYIEAVDVFGKPVKVDTGNPDKDYELMNRMLDDAQQRFMQQGRITTSITSDAPLISELSDMYLHVKSERTRLSSKTIDEYKDAHGTLVFVLGDIRIDQLTTSLLNQFYDKLCQLPANRNKSSLYAGKSFKQLELIDIPDTERISTRTANKKMDRVKSLLEYARKQRLIDHNPADAVVYEKETVSSKDKRQPFSDDDLKRIFESPHYTQNEWRKGQGRREPYRFWLPLLGLFTGARIAELCTLNADDIAKANGVYTINITDEYDDMGNKIKSIKNQNSKRIIPIHNTLIDIGFIEFASKCNTKELFPELNTKQNGVGAAQKWASYFMKQHGVHAKFTKTFHSLRHTFITSAINSGIDAKYVGGVTGHLSKDEFGSVAEIANTYFKGFAPDVLKREVMDKLHYPIELSFTWS